MLAISPADRLFVHTGAGVSAESGIPTFRGQPLKALRLGGLVGLDVLVQTQDIVWVVFLLDRDEPIIV